MRKPIRRAFLVWVLVVITPLVAQMTPATATVQKEKVFVQIRTEPMESVGEEETARPAKLSWWSEVAPGIGTSR